MATSVVSKKKTFHPSSAQHGFTLIEVVISMAILTIGLVSLLSVFGVAIAATQDTQQNMIAKQLATESLESIVTARDTAQLQWNSIQNVADGGIFENGYRPMNQSGGDGIVGTADDAGAGYQTLRQPGPDGIYGTSDDVLLPLSNFQRQIQILPITDNLGNVVASLRSVNITIRYNTPRFRGSKTFVLNTLISQYR